MEKSGEMLEKINNKRKRLEKNIQIRPKPKKMSPSVEKQLMFDLSPTKPNLTNVGTPSLKFAK